MKPKMPQKSRRFTISHSSCDKHIKPIEMLFYEDHTIEVCPRCYCDQLGKELQESVSRKYLQDAGLVKYNILGKESILSDKTILAASFESYQVNIEEEKANKKSCIEYASRYKNGQTFNTILQGVQGTGKSHLGYSILRELNDSGLDVSCLFVSVDKMLRLIKDSFSNKASKYTENYFVKLLSSVDFLVLDDIGAESGAIYTDKVATDFVQRIIYAVTTARQDKSTIVTTNLSSESLSRIYDDKIVSRLLKKPKFVLFKETKDKRITEIPF